MTNSNNIGIVLSFFALWIATYFSVEYQQITGFVIIFLFGILHGANDLRLISKIKNEKSVNNYRKILVYYLTFVTTGVLLFYLLPEWALVIFILVSAYHFGEQHWNQLSTEKNSPIISLFQLVYGLFIFALLFYFHQKEVTVIIGEIIHSPIKAFNFTYLLQFNGLLLIAFSLVMLWKNTIFKNQLPVNLVYLILFTIIFRNSNLIWAFAIYFIIWHSLPSIKDQICFLYGQYSFQNFVQYFKAAFLYWFVSVTGIALLYFLFRKEAVFTALFFSFLAAITFPHVLVIMKMQNRIKEN
ncbi:Brp/Blh family beta-carotene 15,15'-dioxygenase [Flavobacterium sp.]|uniref:Brp/Blh family beta-carotene 15,15'-dioxygenase n=1 Tax=Flavobacterium sp. TaxID=239 RepID=UPI0025F0A9E5|nr:Brp/Blh family beta-carotene 15,15'-dioxygenase [Flavobacterium sp.]